MPDKEDNVKIRKLINLFKKDIKTTITESLKQVSISRRHATIIRQWVKDGCKGTLTLNKQDRNDYRVRKKSNKLVKVECLGSNHSTPYKFWSESKFIRLCPSCTASRKNSSYEDAD